MASFHCTAQMISRQGGKSCVAALAYRSATKLLDQRTGEIWDYTKKANVGHVEILLPDNAPAWIVDIAHECRTDRQSALQKFSDIIEAVEKRKDSQVYREVEFSLPNELTKEQNIEWANAFVQDVLIERGMVAIVNFHFDVDPKTGMEKPHCHTLLSTRHLTDEGFGLKNREWNRKELIDDARDQCAQYQNAALKKYGHHSRVTHLSYDDREVDIDPQTKLGANVQDMFRRGIETDKQKIFDLVRLKNQFKIVKNPEIVFEIVTSKHATFTRKDIAKILNRYIDDGNQFQILLDRLMNSKELVPLQLKTESEAGKEERKAVEKTETKEPEKEESQEQINEQEPVYTTRKMVQTELSLIKTAEALAAHKTHPVPARITNKVITKYHKKFKKEGRLSADQERAIRHVLSGEQISCVVGFAGAGKTTCLQAVKEAWEEAGYSVLGLAPTGKAERSIAACGIRSMTVHRFLRSQEQGRERISRKTIVVLDEAGMLDSRRFSELQAIVAKAGAKITHMGDGNQTQAVEAGPPFRLVTDRIAPAVLETIVRQQIDWQREASRFFGTLQPRKALKLYQGHGCFYGIEEKKPDLGDEAKTIDNYCLARQISGRIWKEMLEDIRARDASIKNDKENGSTVDFEAISQHQDYATHTYWKNMRQYFVETIIHGFDTHKAELEARGVDVKAFEKLVLVYKAAESDTHVSDTCDSGTHAEEQQEIIFEWIENALRKMSYENIVDTRVHARQALVEAWATDRKAFADQSHLMLAFTKGDAHKLNEAARTLMREQGAIKGPDITYQTQTIEEDDFKVQYREYHDRTFAKGDKILFTHNDKGLGVSNGTLGTILSLRQGKIKVLLDGDEKKTVSFAPRLYPFFDNGWATTIRKAQSATVDHVKFLGSWEDYRNLAYVALTRHRHSLKLFSSDLDFWRPEKLIDRLSRIQEKLSGFDYLDAEKLQEQIKQDTQVLWHHWHFKKLEDGIQQGKDFWAALKVTALDVYETIIPPQESEGKEQARLGEEAFLSLEDSEEMRSRNFFKDTELEIDNRFRSSSQHPAGGQPHQGVSGSQESAPQSSPDAFQQKEDKTSATQVLPTQGLPAPHVDFDRLRNQSKIMRNPEIILEIVTAQHSTFTKKDIARVLNEHIDDPTLFQILYNRLSNSKELIELEKPADRSTVDFHEPVFTTQKMLWIEKNLVTQAKAFATEKTHPVAPHIIERVITRFHKKLEEHGGLSADQECAIRHMLSEEQISCVVGFAGAGKTTCLEAVNEAWEEAGYSVLGLAPTGKAAQSIEGCGVRSMTVHKFLKEHSKGKISLSSKTVVVIDEAGMVDSRRFNQLQSLVAEAGSKIVPIGDNSQLQSIDAGPAYRLVCDAVKPVVLETVVRQRIPWQREATRLFGMAQPRQALGLYQQAGAFETIHETMPNFRDQTCCIENFCLARQISGRIWKEIAEDYKAAFGIPIDFEQEGIFELLSKHQDFELHAEWRDRRKGAVETIIHTYGQQKPKLEILGVDGDKLGLLVSHYLATPPEESGEIFEEIEKVLRKMSYGHIVDTRANTKQTLVAAWAADLEAAPERSHLMLAFTNRDTKILNESARQLMRKKGKIVGPDYQFETKYIEEDDFGNVKITRETRQFAQGDRILFTLNHEKLGARNGNLGTVLSLDEETITVALDGKEQQELSFSPFTYPFIDNGWATNIHTTQSATAGDVKLLGSFEQYRNMVYVGMTRHWNSLKVYVSDLDFWREEKVFDRLSRVQEKLSGFDYLDEAAILEKLKPEKPVSTQENTQGNLSSEDKGKVADEILEEEKAPYGFWDSLKMRIGSFFDAGRAAPEDPELTIDSDPDPIPKAEEPIFHQSPQGSQKTDLLDEDYLNLEDTEEKRSGDIFKDPFNTRGKEVFSEEEAEEKRDGTGGDTLRQKNQRRSYSHSYKKQEGKQGEKRQGARRSSDSALQDQQNTTRVGQRNQEAFGQQEGNMDKSSSPSSPDSSAGASNPSLGNDEDFKKKLEAIRDKIKSDYETRIVPREKPLSFEEVDRQLKERIYELATSILGEPKKGSRNSAYLRFGELSEFSVGVRGKHHGIYTNFVTGVKGGPLKLIEDQMGLSSSKEALARAREWLGGYGSTVEHQIVRKAKKEQQEEKLKWQPIVPVPNGVKGPDLTNKYFSYLFEDGSQETARHAYQDAQGRLLGYVVRLERPNPNDPGGKNLKTTRPLAYCENEKGYRYWRSQGFFGEEKLPYGLEKLAQDPAKPILVVEGEKTVDAAQKLLPGYHVLGWIGGAGGVNKTNWSCLVGRDVVVWPDHDFDQASQKAAQKLEKLVTSLNKETARDGRIGIVNLPGYLPDKWDLADRLPEGWMLDTVAQMVLKALPVREEIAAQAEAPAPGEGLNVPDAGLKAETDISSSASPRSSSNASLGGRDSEASSPETSSTIKALKKPSLLMRKQEKFEKDRLPFHQEWCAHLGFFLQHGRFPKKEKEIAAAWWQGERLTAIEGRLYREALKRKEKHDEKQLTLDARVELSKNQKAPDHIMVFGKASDLDKAQLKQFEQHVLIHQDKTGQLPSPSDLEALCQVIKAHSQIMEVEGAHSGIDRQSAMASNTSVSTTGNKQGEQTSEKTPCLASDIYRTLIEQQAILRNIINGGEELRGENKADEMIATLRNRATPRSHDIKDSCSERLDRLDAKIQSVKGFSQDIKSLERNRQNQRGIEM